MADDPRRVVVVGGSIAATETALSLRQLGFDGDLTVLSEERHPPYSRVPLSKGVLAGSESPVSATIAGVEELGVRLGVRAVGLDPVLRLVHVQGAEPVPYDRVVIATGARARRLSPGGLTLRTLDDCVRLQRELAAARDVVVVGAGFLGMEIASTCRSLGVTVTVVDRDPPLARLVGPLLAGRVTAAAEEHGVRIVTAPVADVGKQSVRLEDGRTLTGDVVVEAVGDVPNVEWLAGSGLDIRGGVVVDGHCTAAPGVLAVGDVAVLGGRARMPHWSNALEQARVAAGTVLNGPTVSPYIPSPYYWTEQFGLVLRLVGTTPPHGAETSQDADSLVTWTDDQGAVTTVATVNHRAPIGRLRRMLTFTAPGVPA